MPFLKELQTFIDPFARVEHLSVHLKHALEAIEQSKRSRIHRRRHPALIPEAIPEVMHRYQTQHNRMHGYEASRADVIGKVALGPLEE